jgi:hypothetical protein
VQNVDIPNFTDVFDDIERERFWEPTFPQHYLLLPTITTPGDISLGTSATDMSSLSTPTLTEEEKQKLQTKAGKNTMIRNLKYKATVFEKYKAMGIVSKKLKEDLIVRGFQYPKNSAGHTMCFPWHVQGLCNERCKLAEDQKEHNDAEDQTMCGWCDTDYRYN